MRRASAAAWLAQRQRCRSPRREKKSANIAFVCSGILLTACLHGVVNGESSNGGFSYDIAAHLLSHTSSSTSTYSLSRPTFTQPQTPLDLLLFVVILYVNSVELCPGPHHGNRSQERDAWRERRTAGWTPSHCGQLNRAPVRYDVIPRCSPECRLCQGDERCR